jgi:hypothetical protein
MSRYEIGAPATGAGCQLIDFFSPCVMKASLVHILNRDPPRSIALKCDFQFYDLKSSDTLQSSTMVVKMDESDSRGLLRSDTERLAPKYCQIVKSKIWEKREFRHFKFPPSDCPEEYFPRKRIIEVFKDDNCLSNVSKCPCPDCFKDAAVSEAADNRYIDEEELLGRYATIYALLIWLNRPGLIRLFQKNSVCLSIDNFLSSAQLGFLLHPDVEFSKALIDDIVRGQYKFNVRMLEARKVPVWLEREVLPIKEDIVPKAKGEFGRVYGFSIPHSEYRGNGFKEVIISYPTTKSKVQG